MATPEERRELLQERMGRIMAQSEILRIQHEATLKELKELDAVLTPAPEAKES